MHDEVEEEEGVAAAVGLFEMQTSTYRVTNRVGVDSHFQDLDKYRVSTRFLTVPER